MTSPFPPDQSSTASKGWCFWVDRGGTFTDVVALRPDGELLTRKLLSVNPDHYADAAVEGVRRLLEQFPRFGRRVDVVKLGTTVATNALLERKGARVALMISSGLRDQLAIGHQTRPDLFAVHIPQSPLLYQSVYEVSERVLADGTVEQPLDEVTVRLQLQQAREQGFDSLAVVLMHSYRFPAHERRIRELAREPGFSQISLSHEVSPLVKLIERGDTTLVDACLTPVLREYLAGVEQALAKLCPGARLEVMQSNGGLAPVTQVTGKDAVLSGPAGGVVGMTRTAEADGYDRLIGFDMGGTSTDVSHYAGELERESKSRIGGVGLRVPMMNIHTVAAGGGSIVHFSDGRLQVGPHSAGAWPGPACYRNGGPLTVTDCNLILGRLQPDYFPAIFGPGQDQPLDLTGVQQQFESLAQAVSEQTGVAYDALSLAQGFIDIAVENMARAARSISVQRGYDVRDYTLVAFGGAGAQHACLVAEALGMRRVYLHPAAGVLSAFGIGIADQRWIADASVDLPLDGVSDDVVQAHKSDNTDADCDQDIVGEKGQHQNRLIRAIEQLQQQAEAAASRGFYNRDQSHCVNSHQDVWRAYLRYQGADTPIVVALDTVAAMQQCFERQHQQLFGFCNPQQTIQIDAIQLERVWPGAPVPPCQAGGAGDRPAAPTLELFSKDRLYRVAVQQREQLLAGSSLIGPALVMDANSTLIVEAGWQARTLASGALVFEPLEAESVNPPAGKVDAGACQQPGRSASDAVDPVRLEVFNNLFMAAAEQMGQVLEKTASSVNIKERLDFSCAIFDSQGDLVANAPHIPVHLGSMSASVLAVMQRHPDMVAGDAFVLNSPYEGGTHLPDITVVKPVFLEHGQPPLFVAARGHHADIGGITPGSMPANSHTLEEEGVLLDNLVLMRNGEFQQDSLLRALTSGAWPARNPRQNLADLQAQLAACEAGARALRELCQQHGERTVINYMCHVQDNAEHTLRESLAELSPGKFEQQMDDGTVIRVRIDVDPRDKTAVIDFTGSGYRPDQPVHPGNFNAPESVVRAAVLYAFRVLVARPMPLNAGFFRPLTIRIPPASLLAPEYPAAVVSGNVETAQYLVDTLMGALGLMAGCQGTNNNLTFGNANYQYYETLCGGIGASALGDGASGVHGHMTNSRLTDPEILELRYPVVLDHFHLRTGSGGAGRYRGGDGVERHIRFLQPMTANIISGRRQQVPFGLQGGAPAACGANFVLRGADSQNMGRIQMLRGCDRVELNCGDSICIHTPGGGGFGQLNDD